MAEHEAVSVLRKLVAELEATIRDGERRKHVDTLARKREDMGRAVETARQERAALEETKARLAATAQEQRLDVDRLSAEHVSLEAQRAALGADITDMEAAIHGSTTELGHLGDRNDITRLRREVRDIEDRLLSLDTRVVTPGPAHETAPMSTPSRYALLDAWLADEPAGAVDEPPETSIAADISRLRTRLQGSGDGKCAAALRAVIEAQRVLEQPDAPEPVASKLPPVVDPAQQLQHLQQMQSMQQQLQALLLQQQQTSEMHTRTHLERQNERLQADMRELIESRRRSQRTEVGTSPRPPSDMATPREDLEYEQRRELARLDFEREKLVKSSALKTLQEDLERDRHEDERRRDHAEWLEAQRRKMQALRIDKALAQEEKASGLDPFLPDGFQSYDERSGIGARFDFVVGPSNGERARSGQAPLDKVRLVYALHNADGSPLAGPGGKAQATPWVAYADATQQAVRTGVAVFATGAAAGLATFPEVRASPQLRLVCELQAGNESTKKGKVDCLGWAAAPVFVPGLAPPSIDDGDLVPHADDTNDFTLAVGAWVMPLREGTYSPKHAWPPDEKAAFTVYARIFFASMPPTASSVDPFAVHDRYHAWGSGTKKGTRLHEAASADPPASVKLRAYTLEMMLQSHDLARRVKVRVATSDGRSVWTSPTLRVEAELGWLASWEPHSHEFVVDYSSIPKLPVALKWTLLEGEDEAAEGNLEIIDAGGRLATGDAIVTLRTPEGEVRGRASVAVVEDGAIALAPAASASSLSTTATTGDEAFLVEARLPDPKDAFGRGDGIDVIVDGIRGLPDNAGASKVSVKLIANGAQVGETRSGLATGGTRYSPSYGLVAEFREPVFDPTSTLVFRVDVTDEARDDTCCCGGYALLNVFCAPGDASNQPKTSREQNYCLVSGARQLPLRRSTPDVVDLTASSLDSKPKVLGATILVRVDKAPRTPPRPPLSRADVPFDEWSGLRADRKPSYALGAYDSSRCTPLAAHERRVNRRRQRRTDAPLVAPPSTKTFAATPTSFLDYRFSVPYDKELGLSVAVDGLNHMPDACFYKVVTVVSPPGLYLKGVADDAQFTMDHDLDAPSDAPRFLDGPKRFRHKATPRHAAFFEVRPMRVLKGDKRDPCIVDVATEKHLFYWAALPLFARAPRLPRTAYVDSGAFLLPLFVGAVPPAALDASNVADAAVDNLGGPAAATPGSKKRKPGPWSLAPNGESLIVRIVDAHLDDDENLSAFHPPDRKEYAVAAAVAANRPTAAYSFDYGTPTKSKKALHKLAPKGIAAADLHRALNQAFALASGIRHA